MFSYMWFVFLFVVVVDAQAPTTPTEAPTVPKNESPAAPTTGSPTAPTGALCPATPLPQACTPEECANYCKGREIITASTGEVCVVKPTQVEQSTAYFADNKCSCGKTINNNELHCSDYDVFPIPTQQDCTDICNEKAVFAGVDGKAYCTELQGGNPRPVQGTCLDGASCQCA